MKSELRVFLDTSVLFSAVLSPGGGSRMVLKLGEAGTISIWVGSRVLQEIDGVIQRKAPHSRPDLALLLEVSEMQLGPRPDEAALARARTVIAYAPDAYVLAEALVAEADYFVTLDRKHFLDNPRISTLPFPLGTPGDFLAYLRKQL